MSDNDDDVTAVATVEDTAVLVRIAPAPPIVQEAPADVSTWNTFTLKGDGSTAAQPMLAFLPHRHKAQIIVTGGAAGDYVVIGRQSQQANGMGARIPVGTGPIPIESKSAVYINRYVSAGADIFVTVVEELYTV